MRLWGRYRRQSRYGRSWRRNNLQQGFNPDLATSVHNLAENLYAIGRRDEALEAIQQAVGIWRELVMEHPAAFNPHLATSLNDLAQNLYTIGRPG